MTIIKYKPYQERLLDWQYQNLLRFIRCSSETYLAKNPYQDRGRWTNLETPRMVFKFENGFPIITERKISFWKTAITEIILFLNGARKFEDMLKAGCGWWAEWTSLEKCKDLGLQVGDLGPGSYGPILHNLPNFVWDQQPYGCSSYKNQPFNQIEHLIQSLKDGPGLNTHVISTWYPPFDMQHSKLQRQVSVAPCHGTKMQFTVINGKKLVYTMTQRSGDVPVGVVSNIIQHAALCIMVAHVCRYEPYKYIHVVDDAQIYENQIEKVDELLDRIPFRLPTLQLTKEGQEIKNIFDFKADHFELSDYECHPAMKIPTTL
ncbi:MAG: thymidylate synthase [Candidatus Zambryskibacteria bacterium]|nr:thymidylate synthase [Candidatus Zambryskibacteria bacterium]